MNLFSLQGSAGVMVGRSITEALSLVREAEEVMVIGGASFYAQLLPLAQRLYITEIHHDFAGDAYFPAWKAGEWREIERNDHPGDDDNPYPYSFVTLERRAAAA